MLLRPHRITNGDDFSQVRRHGRVVPHPFVLVAWVSSSLATTRFGFSVSKKVGNAVVRNSVKRRLREVARRELPDLVGGYDIVITARQDAAHAEWDQLSDAVCRALRRGQLYAAQCQPARVSATSAVVEQKP